MKIGVFGGTFSPPHIGHLIVAEHVCWQLSLDRVLFVPASTPPHKIDDEIVDAHHRLEMLRLAIQNNPRFACSDLEIRRGGVSFTVDSLQQLKIDHPADQLFLLIGMDNLLEFHTWKAPEKILALAQVVVMTRPGFAESDVPSMMRDKVNICPVPEIGVASREIRRRVRNGMSIQYLVVDAVAEYIRAHKLFVTAER